MLSGPSTLLDPTTHAVRPDLADVRLARRVFAPHYAAHQPRVIAVAAPLRRARDGGSDVLATLPAGAAFELLDLTGDAGWGVAPAERLVGYVDARVLGEPGA